MTSGTTPDLVPGGLDKSYLDGKVGFLIRKAQLALFQNFFDRLAKLDLRPAEFSALCLVDANPGSRASDLAETLMIKKPNIVPLLAGLEARNLVERAQSKADKRSQELSLTGEGRALLREAKLLVDQQDACIAAHLGEEAHARLLDLLQQMEGIDYSA